MHIHIFGLGPTLQEFNNLKNEFTIGVNDIYKHYPTDMVVCVDPPERFPKERREVMDRCKPKAGFLSNCQSWSYHPNYKQLHLAGRRGDVSRIDWDNIPKSTNSPFVACCIAYLMGAKRIILWGVDLNDHPELNNSSNEQATFEHYKLLSQELRKRGTDLVCGSVNSGLVQRGILKPWVFRINCPDGME